MENIINTLAQAIEQVGFRNYCYSTKNGELKYNDIYICDLGDYILITIYLNKDNQHYAEILVRKEVSSNIISFLKGCTWSLSNSKDGKCIKSHSFDKKGKYLQHELFEYGISKDDIKVVRNWNEAS